MWQSRYSWLLMMGILFGCLILIFHRWISGQHGWIEGETYQLVGIISQDPVVVWNEFKNTEGWWVWVKIEEEKVGVVLPRHIEVSKYDQILAAFHLSGMVNGSNSYAGWYANVDNVQIRKSSNTVILTLRDLRGKLISVYRLGLPVNEGSLLAGIVLGAKGLLSDSLEESMQVTGTIHVVVASGFNVQVVAMALFKWLVRWFHRKQALLLTGLWVGVYWILAGGDPPIMRASLMLGLLLAAQVWGRVIYSIWVIVWSALLLLLISPSWIFDLSWQLSMAATLGLIYVSPIVDKLVENLLMYCKKTNNLIDYLIPLNRYLAVKESFVSTLSAQVFVLPLLAYTFEEISVLSLLVNVLVLWMIPWLTILGMIVGLVGVWWFDSSRLLIWIVYPLAKLFIEVIQFIGETAGDLALLQWNFEGQGVAIYYVLLVILVFWARKRWKIGSSIWS